MIILIRHAQSEGNKNREIHQTTPDHRVKLTSEGHRQAHEAGLRLRELLRPDDTLHSLLLHIAGRERLRKGSSIRLLYEEPRLREQDFGNFQPCSAEMERMWMERADYGHFFYRIPNGESAADAYDRVSGFNESLWRLFGEDDFANVCVLVTHGLMTRVFLMKWYHWSVEYFEDLRNINHCEFVILTHNPDNGKYTLQNKLRTWSDLRKERDLERNIEKESKELSPVSSTPATEHVPIRRRWGGCPDGCNHGLSAESKRSLRNKLAEQMRPDTSRSKAGDITVHGSKPATASQASTASATTPANPEDTQYSNEQSTNNNNNDDPSSRSLETKDIERPSQTGDSSLDSPANRVSRPPLTALPSKNHNRNSEDHLFHNPSSSSSSAYLQLALLHLGGRDGGGSLSGANSLAPSDDETDDTTHRRNRNHGHSRLASDRVSHDHGEDGDDELSAAPGEGTKRSRPHHHHTHHNHYHVHTNISHHRHTSSSVSLPPPRMANILGDGDDASTHSDSPESGYSGPSSNTHPEGDQNTDEPGREASSLSLEAQREEDQSIHGSVY
ncbi:Histidine phosphatase superfamily clade-1 [Penicillium chermesinum]|uniref:Histidine phosphatase superfamily clade-1 n=1 Tax=Penicillium chermesinum TaxID=63820 RepID=A0A9W9P8M6_9EURO|nr:Histidine phosphatase superfamily clade-1 [Penicillium chermesinum]KAJ5239837.1 Histidine phosphatase superfamily clade-1 [Penicillium chermesinum]